MMWERDGSVAVQGLAQGWSCAPNDFEEALALAVLQEARRGADQALANDALGSEILNPSNNDYWVSYSSTADNLWSLILLFVKVCT